MQELEPWVLLHGAGEPSVALWQVFPTGQLAIALFSESSKAEAYARQGELVYSRIVQPDRIELIGLLVEAYRQGVRWAALDPTADRAAKLFDLKEVLKAARSELQHRQAD